MSPGTDELRSTTYRFDVRNDDELEFSVVLLERFRNVFTPRHTADRPAHGVAGFQQRADDPHRDESVSLGNQNLAALRYS